MLNFKKRHKFKNTNDDNGSRAGVGEKYGGYYWRFGSLGSTESAPAPSIPCFTTQAIRDRPISTQSRRL